MSEHKACVWHHHDYYLDAAGLDASIWLGGCREVKNNWRVVLNRDNRENHHFEAAMFDTKEAAMAAVEAYWTTSRLVMLRMMR